MDLGDLLNFVALFFSPWLAIYTSLLVQNNLERKKWRRDKKLWVFENLLMLKDLNLQDNHRHALLLVDIFYHDSEQVRSKWSEYFGLWQRKDLGEEEVKNLLKQKHSELLQEMGTELGVSGRVHTSL